MSDERRSVSRFMFHTVTHPISFPADRPRGYLAREGKLRLKQNVAGRGGARARDDDGASERKDA